jgi:raffinose/stachyose/melibiose transport system permease protein
METKFVVKKMFFRILYVVIILFVSVIVLFPMIFIISSSFKTEEMIFSSPWSLPTKISFKTYITLFQRFNMGNYLVNSVFYALCGSCFCCLIAYLISGLMIPIHGILVPLFITMSKLHISNKFALLMIYVSSSIPTALFLFIGNLKALPFSVEESAIMDGCTLPQVVRKIVLPVSQSVIASVIIVTFLSIWNDLLLALVFLGNEKEKTIQVGIMRFQDDQYTNYGLLLSAIVMAILPMVVIFECFSKQIVSGMTAGAVKG